MDQLEFSIAMKLIKLKLQGQSLPVVLPPIMKQPPVFSPLISARFGNQKYLINVNVFSQTFNYEKNCKNISFSHFKKIYMQTIH